MELQNLLFHKKNTAVSVNGHIYKIAQDLIIRDDAGNAVDVPQTDADVLLANKTAWKVANAPKATRDAHKGTIKLITDTGKVIERETTSIPVTKPPEHVAKVGMAGHAIPPDPKAVKAAVEPPIPVTKPQEDPPIPSAPNEEWADPSEQFSIEWLRLCAKAYKVKYRKDDKATLVTKIKAAMYE